MEENPSGATSALTRFLGASSSALPQMRMTPAEVAANQTGSDQIASSGLAGVSTKVLFGNPSSSGFYTIVLFVPAHTTIPAHAHRDDVPRGGDGCGDTRLRTPLNASGKRVVAANVETPPMHR
jgi:hypothetical protein